ncbi:gp53-like domain-containing protein [Chromobacterium violaceum]|uniref:gp53-like domain-containing protein n=1 Tax=Chromobacterium violaceum TaxID=536 RepID=UPI0009F11635|nr:interleukin-like EMT inducer domain-containing protein [Chromobacterium violaceum]OQS08394.1 hypothetical protein B0T38_20235 [Chromobacterium violaceum]OQS21338.1 hypothetical protein B0T37_19835 [Chromobacterium violaceum]OQS45400.1 hypothetical protein B0T48_19410 [Chromobacterium violaceum]OQS47078.1 hypothetical protein B0T49_18495 [Chromobacterium violaceum]QRO32076.1 hypothetical protein I6K04_16480 [Chromobacterium violaceum]
MANLQEKPFWEPGIYQLETSDPVLAGPDGIDNLQGKQLANRTVHLKERVDKLESGEQPSGNAAKLSAARKIEITGDGSWNVVFDGSKDVSGQLALRDSGVAPGNYGQVTVDAKGRVTAARSIVPDDVPALDWSKIVSGKPTTLAGYGIADGASKSDLQSAVNGLVSNAPANLNTLQELATAINNDPKFSATVDAKLAGKADKATTLAGYGITDGASKTDLKTAIDGVVAGAPGALNTLQELATALGNDANYAASMTKLLSAKADKATTLAGYGITDAVASAQGMMLRGTVDQTQLDTVSDPGFRAVNRSGFTSTLVTMNAGGSVGPLQLEAFYSGDLRWRNQTDSKSWNNWKGIWHSGNFRPDDKADKASTLAGYGILDAVGKNDFSQLVNKVASRKLVRVRATGYAVPNRTSYLEIDGIVKSYGARSYNMAQLDSQGNIARDAAFDIAGGSGQAQAAADWLNAVPDGAWVIVYTSDEPQGNRDPSGAFGKALYRCGASHQIFSSRNFFYRSAYILIGQAGCGEGKGREYYRGDGPSSPNAQLDVNFDLINGEPVLPAVAPSGASFGAAGYQVLPSGLIIQWNNSTAAAQGGADGIFNSFPIEFPNSCLAVLSVHAGTDTSVNIVVQSWSNTGVVLRSNYAPAGSGVQAPYFAIGY